MYIRVDYSLMHVFPQEISSLGRYQVHVFRPREGKRSCKRDFWQPTLHQLCTVVVVWGEPGYRYHQPNSPWLTTSFLSRLSKATHLIRIEAEGVDGAWPGLRRYDRRAYGPVPNVYSALAIRTHRTQQPSVMAEVQAADLGMGAYSSNSLKD